MNVVLGCIGMYADDAAAWEPC